MPRFFSFAQATAVALIASGSNADVLIGQRILDSGAPFATPNYPGATVWWWSQVCSGRDQYIIPYCDSAVTRPGAYTFEVPSGYLAYTSLCGQNYSYPHCSCNTSPGCASDHPDSSYRPYNGSSYSTAPGYNNLWVKYVPISTIRLHLNTNGSADVVPTGGVTVTLSLLNGNGTTNPLPGGSTTTSPASITVTPGASYVVRSTTPTGYETSATVGSGGKEVVITAPSRAAISDVTFNYTTAIYMATWLGDYDPPSATPSGAGLGQWRTAACGETERVGALCPPTSSTVWKRTSTQCTSDADCANQPSNSQCAPPDAMNATYCGHTAGATLYGLSLNNNISPTTGAFQIRSDLTRYAGHSLRVQIQSGDNWSDANDRNELDRSGDVTTYTEGQEGWFSWSFWIDSLAFEAVAVTPGATVNNPFNVLTQWHHSGECASNPIGFGITRQTYIAGSGDANTYAMGLSSTQAYLDPGDNSVPDFPTTSHHIWVAPGTVPYSGTPATSLKQKWHDYLLHIKWSTTAGFVELWYRSDATQPYVQQGLSCAAGAPFSSPRCQLKTLYTYPTQQQRAASTYLTNMPDLCFQEGGQFVYGQVQPNYIKQGWYRAHGLTSTSVIYHDGMTQGAYINDVMPSGASCQCVKPWSNGSQSCALDEQPCPL